MQNPPSPFTLVLYVLGVIFAVPSLRILWNAATYIIGSRHQLDALAREVGEMRTSVDAHVEETRRERHERRNRDQLVEIGLTLIETDVNALQRASNVHERNYPSRRIGE